MLTLAHIGWGGGGPEGVKFGSQDKLTAPYVAVYFIHALSLEN